MSNSRKFRLASVLRVARLREDIERAHTAARAAEEAAAERAEQARTAAYEALPPATTASATEFDEHRAVSDLRARSLADAAAAREDATDRLLAARSQWLAESRRVRSLEELEDRHHAAQAMVAARAAQRVLDDLVRIRRQL